MQETMGGEDLRKALIALGERLRARTDIVVGGAGALILNGELPRATSDFDVLYSDPDIGRLQEDIRAVADRLDLTPGWLNGSIQTYLDVPAAGLQGASHHIAGAGKASHRAATPA